MNKFKAICLDLKKTHVYWNKIILSKKNIWNAKPQYRLLEENSISYWEALKINQKS